MKAFTYNDSRAPILHTPLYCTSARKVPCISAGLSDVALEEVFKWPFAINKCRLAELEIPKLGA